MTIEGSENLQGNAFNTADVYIGVVIWFSVVSIAPVIIIVCPNILENDTTCIYYVVLTFWVDYQLTFFNLN